MQGTRQGRSSSCKISGVNSTNKAIFKGDSPWICELRWTVNYYVKCFIVKFLIKFFGVQHTLSVTWSTEKTNAYCAMTKANGCLFTELDTYGENILTNYLPFSKTENTPKSNRTRQSIKNKDWEDREEEQCKSISANPSFNICFDIRIPRSNTASHSFKLLNESW